MLPVRVNLTYAGHKIHSANQVSSARAGLNFQARFRKPSVQTAQCGIAGTQRCQAWCGCESTTSTYALVAGVWRDKFRQFRCAIFKRLRGVFFPVNCAGFDVCQSPETAWRRGRGDREPIPKAGIRSGVAAGCCRYAGCVAECGCQKEIRPRYRGIGAVRRLRAKRRPVALRPDAGAPVDQAIER